MTAVLVDDAEITVLDVGHGNAAVLRCAQGTIVVDAALGPILSDELDRTSTRRIEHLVLSHADRDHIGGAVGLLSGEVEVGTLWFNPDSLKQTDTFGDLAAKAHQMHEDGLLGVATNLNTGAGTISVGSLEVAVLHPDILSAATGPRAAGHRYGAASANSMSAVLRVSVEGTSQMLMCADIDKAGLDVLLARRVDLSARVLVFPHHGGRSGGDDTAFAHQLCAAVNPEVVIFSLGRGGYLNPQPDIVAGVRAAVPQAHIACTQLSTHCQGANGSIQPAHLVERPAAGRASGACCAGTIVLNSTGEDLPMRASHRDFIAENVQTPLCQRSTSLSRESVAKIEI